MKTHLQKIDFLRGIAILLVFSYHSSMEVFGPVYEIKHVGGLFLDPADFSTSQLFINFLPSAFGWSGVELFLVISGFLIHYNYLKKGSFKALLFFNKRFWRIWPPYFLALVLFSFTVPAKDIQEFFVHALLIHNLTESDFFSINPSFWSLALEAQLYAIYPLFLFLRRKMGMNKTVILIFCMQMVLTAIAMLFKIGSARYQSFVLNYWIVWVLGAYLAERYSQGKRLLPISFIPLIGVLAGIMVLRFTALYLHFSFLFFTVFYVLLIDWMLHTKQEKFFSGKTYHFISGIGLFSYSIYLFHQPHLGLLIKHLTFGSHPVYLLVAAILSFLFFYAVSYCTYTFLELPSVKFGERFYKRIFQKKMVNKKPMKVNESK